MRPGIVLCLLLLFAPPGRAADLAEVRLLASNLAPYVGEELLLTLEIRSRQPGRPLQPVWPESAGYSAEDLPYPPPQRGIDAAGPFLLQQVRRAIVPLQAGSLVIADAGVENEVTRSLAAPLRLRVRPLPEPPAGLAIAGVGAAELSLAGQGAGTREVTLTLRGSGPLERFGTPAHRLGRGEQLVLLGEEEGGTPGEERLRSWHYLYLPGEGRKGELVFELTLFDPQQGGYRTLRTDLDGRRWTWVPATVLLIALAGLVLLRAGGWSRDRRDPLDRALEKVLGCSPADCCRRELLQRLAQAGVTASLRERLAALWRNEELRFAPGSPPVAENLPLRRRLALELLKAVRKSIDKRGGIH